MVRMKNGHEKLNNDIHEPQKKNDNPFQIWLDIRKTVHQQPDT